MRRALRRGTRLVRDGAHALRHGAHQQAQLGVLGGLAARARSGSGRRRGRERARRGAAAAPAVVDVAARAPRACCSNSSRLSPTLAEVTTDERAAARCASNVRIPGLRELGLLMRRTLALTATLEPMKLLGPATLAPRKAVGLAARGACAESRCRRRQSQPDGRVRRSPSFRRSLTARSAAGGSPGAGAARRGDKAPCAARDGPIYWH